MSKQPRKFEYMLVVMENISTVSAATGQLDYWGQKGWELCGFEYGSFIFKRERHDEE